MLARYTPFEARALENHYIAGAIKEGIWGKGIPPKSLYQPPLNDNGPKTPQGIKRMTDAQLRKERILKLVKAGYDNATSITEQTRYHDSTVRKFLRMLDRDGEIYIARIGPQGEKIWKVKDTVTGR